MMSQLSYSSFKHWNLHIMFFVLIFLSICELPFERHKDCPNEWQEVLCIEEQNLHDIRISKMKSKILNRDILINNIG